MVELMCFFDAGRVVDFLEEHPSIEESQGNVNMRNQASEIFIYSSIISFFIFDESFLSFVR